MGSIIDLPQDVLELIAEALLDPTEDPYLLHLDQSVKQECINLRLSCKTLSGLDTVRRTLFGTFNLFLTNRSVQNLRRLSASPTISAAVRTLRFWHPLIAKSFWSRDNYYERVLKWQPHCTRKSLNRKVRIGRPIVQRLKREQDFIIRNFLQTIEPYFVKLGNTRCVETAAQRASSDCEGENSGHFYLTRHFPELCVPELGGHFVQDALADDFLHLILRIVGRHQPHVKEFNARGGFSQMFSAACSPRLDSGCRVAEEESTFKSLERLDLTLAPKEKFVRLAHQNAFDEFSEASQEANACTLWYFCRTLQWPLSNACNLRHLRLSIAPYHDMFERMHLWTTQDIQWLTLKFPELITMMIGSAQLAVEPFSEFLKSHSASLRHLILESFKPIPESRQSWKHLFMAIHGGLELETVKISSAHVARDLINVPLVDSSVASGPVSETQEQPLALRDYLLHLTGLTPDLEVWMNVEREEKHESDWEDTTSSSDLNDDEYDVYDDYEGYDGDFGELGYDIGGIDPDSSLGEFMLNQAASGF